jgi:hypothetical protein
MICRIHNARKIWHEETGADLVNTLKTAFKQMEGQARQMPATQNKGEVIINSCLPLRTKVRS